MFEKTKQVAAEEGYELAYGEESHGQHMFGLQIFVKMSNRKLTEEDRLYAAAELIKEQIGTVTAKLDPEGPAQRESYRAEIHKIYEDAGITAIYMEALPNGYCTRPCCLNKPWFRVTSSIGHVTIGWRKSVISMDWKDSLINASGQDLFPKEDVTRWETGIHAWGSKKATEYIRWLHMGRLGESKVQGS